jgi:hypothetical protein
MDQGAMAGQVGPAATCTVAGVGAGSPTVAQIGLVGRIVWQLK